MGGVLVHMRCLFARHQPRPDIFFAADQVIFMDRGSVCFYGLPSRAADFSGSLAAAPGRHAFGVARKRGGQRRRLLWNR